jgi:hypothetical protein
MGRGTRLRVLRAGSGPQDTSFETPQVGARPSGSNLGAGRRGQSSTNMEMLAAAIEGESPSFDLSQTTTV